MRLGFLNNVRIFKEFEDVEDILFYGIRGGRCDLKWYMWMRSKKISEFFMGNNGFWFCRVLSYLEWKILRMIICLGLFFDMYGIGYID